MNYKIKLCKKVAQKDGNFKILVQTTAGQDVWITIPQWKNAGLSMDTEKYNGGSIEAEFYEVGEPLFGSTVAEPRLCTQADTIPKEFSVAGNPEVLAYAHVVEANRTFAEAEAKALAYAKKKQAERKALADLVIAEAAAEAARIAAGGSPEVVGGAKAGLDKTLEKQIVATTE